MSEGRARFGTFAGVFRPTLLTILGAMLYLREGWVVGNSGLLGAIAIIAFAYVITGTTAMSLSSIATNVRVRPGGAFAIISQALGLEAGGAIGIPLFVAQTASAAMYLYAFSEGWQRLFGGPDPRIVVACAFVGVVAVAWASAALAAQAQAVLLGLVAVALTSAAAGAFTQPALHVPQWIGTFSEAGPFETFALFFPAATGIMVGAGMSGSLADPRRAIPRGTLTAWGLSGGISLGAAVWYAVVADPAELRTNMTVSVDRALFGPLVLLGLLVSTLMAALSSLVAAPRLLQAMAEQGVVPGASYWRQLDDSGEPRKAVIATAALASLGLLSGSLDAIAPVVTAFFILTYLAVNVVVALEQRFGMISFRPTFRISRTVPVVGIVTCAIGLLLASPRWASFGFVVVVGIYGWLLRRQLDTPWETVRSGVAVQIATWAARLGMGLERGHRAWHPDVLLPVAARGDTRHLLPFAAAIAAHSGSVTVLGIGGSDVATHVEAAGEALRAQRIYATWTTLPDRGDFALDVELATAALDAALFPPNLVIVDAEQHDEAVLQRILDACVARRVGLCLLMPCAERDDVGARGPDVAVWLSSRAPGWELSFQLSNLDLPGLVGYLLQQEWGGRLRLITVVADAAEQVPAQRFLDEVIDQGRLPDAVGEARVGAFADAFVASEADVHVFGMATTVDVARMRRLRDAAGATCVFLLDSGRESLLA